MGGGCSLAGRRQPTCPASEDGPASPSPSPPPPPARRTAAPRARPTASAQRRRVDGMHARPTPRPTPPPVDSPSALAISSSTLCALSCSLSLSHLRSARTHTAVAIGAFKLHSGHSSSTSAPFFDSFFPELRSRSSVAEHTSKRLVMLGKTLLALAFFSGVNAVAARVASASPCFSPPPS